MKSRFNIKVTPLLIAWMMIIGVTIKAIEIHFHIPYLFTITIFALLLIDLIRVGIIIYKAYKD